MKERFIITKTRLPCSPKARLFPRLRGALGVVVYVGLRLTRYRTLWVRL